jgi:transcription termination factor Rho
VGTKISIGFATWLGTIGAAAGVVIPLIGELSDAAAPLGVPGQVWVVMGAILGTAVVIGRMAQAVAQVMKDAPSEADLYVDELPDEPTDMEP